MFGSIFKTKGPSHHGGLVGRARGHRLDPHQGYYEVCVFSLCVHFLPLFTNTLGLIGFHPNWLNFASMKAFLNTRFNINA